MLRVMILFLVVFVSGCATNMLTPKSLTLTDLGDSKGILIGSFARDPVGPIYNLQAFKFRNMTTGEEHKIRAQPVFNLYTGKTSDDFKLSGSHGGVFALSLPAGKYAFYDFRLFQSNGYYSKNWTSKEQYEIPFEVYSNKVNYVGEIKLSPFTGKNIFGMKLHAGGIWFISDESERDVGILSKKYPNIPLNNIVNIIPSEKSVFTPLVILPSELGKYNI